MSLEERLNSAQKARDARRAKNKNASLFDWISTHRGGDIETCHAGAIRDEISRLLQMGDTGNLEETEAGLRKIFNPKGVGVKDFFMRDEKEIRLEIFAKNFELNLSFDSASFYLKREIEERENKRLIKSNTINCFGLGKK